MVQPLIDKEDRTILSFMQELNKKPTILSFMRNLNSGNKKFTAQEPQKNSLKKEVLPDSKLYIEEIPVLHLPKPYLPESKDHSGNHAYQAPDLFFSQKPVSLDNVAMYNTRKECIIL